MDQVDPNFLYLQHPYVTGANAPMVSYFRDMAGSLARRYGLASDDLVLDIGCNDGTLLNGFRASGVRTLGVEPSAALCATAAEDGHELINDFWSESLADDLVGRDQKPRLITATAVFYHIPDLHDFLRGVDKALAPGGVFVVQAVSLLSLLEGLQFDHFYHEHTCIHSMIALTNLLAPHGLHIFNWEYADVQGGSFIAHIGRRAEHPSVDASVPAQLAKEQDAGLDTKEVYQTFAAKVDTIARDFKAMLGDLARQGHKVHGLGAPVKSATILNYGGVGRDLISALEEVNENKIGKLSPGQHIPVIAETALHDAPDYFVVFAWNYLPFFLEKKRDFLERGGKFIVYLPEVRVIDA